MPERKKSPKSPEYRLVDDTTSDIIRVVRTYRGGEDRLRKAVARRLLSFLDAFAATVAT